MAGTLVLAWNQACSWTVWTARSFVKSYLFTVIVLAASSLLSDAEALHVAQSGSDNALRERAHQEFRDDDYAAAERDYAVLTAHDPSDIYAQVFLGQSLFNEQKYPEAIRPYEKAQDLEKDRKILSLDQKRILTDQLAMAHGISGQLKKAHALLEEAVRQDPKYPLN